MEKSARLRTTEVNADVTIANSVVNRQFCGPPDKNMSPNNIQVDDRGLVEFSARAQDGYKLHSNG
jgi:hypothetical protein